MTDKPSLESAYALKTPDDSRRLYADWAQSYDDDFAASMDYLLPKHVARIFLDQPSEGAVLDVGAGTGLVADAIQTERSHVMDALDISPAMLAVAKRKGRYRACIEADLTRDLPLADASYGAVVSSGTFTHGHVGPEALDELLRVAQRGALFVLSVNAEHFESRGFAAKFDALARCIEAFRLITVAIYGPASSQGLRQDQGHLAVFRKR
ncbi:class I SAM-dependent methyltransferase [Sulfitobacter sp. LCG007]